MPMELRAIWSPNSYDGRRFVSGDQSGRTSAPINPHRVQTTRARRPHARLVTRHELTHGGLNLGRTCTGNTRFQAGPLRPSPRMVDP
jgi:hypothetical protein